MVAVKSAHAAVSVQRSDINSLWLVRCTTQFYTQRLSKFFFFSRNDASFIEYFKSLSFFKCYFGYLQIKCQVVKAKNWPLRSFASRVSTSSTPGAGLAFFCLHVSSTFLLIASQDTVFLIKTLTTQTAGSFFFKGSWELNQNMLNEVYEALSCLMQWNIYNCI